VCTKATRECSPQPVEWRPLALASHAMLPTRCRACHSSSGRSPPAMKTCKARSGALPTGVPPRFESGRRGFVGAALPTLRLSCHVVSKLRTSQASRAGSPPASEASEARVRRAPDQHPESGARAAAGCVRSTSSGAPWLKDVTPMPQAMLQWLPCTERRPAKPGREGSVLCLPL
jgi:hypothetical protein